MILGIDAFNLSRGGGITHLVEFLGAADPVRYSFHKVVLWGGAKTLAKVADQPWLIKVHEPWLDRGLFWRILWHRFVGARRAHQAGCDVVFMPGGTVASGFRPAVTMSRNMLPFELPELMRYGASFITLKLLLLRWVQSRSFQKADGVIFLSQYARNVITSLIRLDACRVTTVPHGINKRFFAAPRETCRGDFTEQDPCRILYVSTISPYKHHCNVVEAVAQLRAEGCQVVLELVGPADVALKDLKAVMRRCDPHEVFVFYRGSAPHELLARHYASADIGLFASSCENMPNILLEGMASGLPLACSDRGPMPEMLGDAGEYFNPVDPSDIAAALRRLLNSDQLRVHHSRAAYLKASRYSWETCANDTLKFLENVARNRAAWGK